MAYRTLTSAQIARIASALERGFYLVGGDKATFVDKDGTEFEDLLCLMMDMDLESADGIKIDIAGIKDIGEREVYFLKTYLTASNCTISVDGHFLIDGERWDFAKDEAKKDAIVPLAGIQNMIACRIRRATELDRSTPTVDGFTWGE